MKRTFLIIAGAVTSVIAIGLIGLGGLALWGESEKDERGYVSTDAHHFATGTHAIATENLDVDLDGAEGLVDSTDLGDIRLEVSPGSEKPLFVGIARTDEVSAYLGGVSHTTVTDLDYEPFEARYSSQPGERSPTAPGGERIWAASTHGVGPQTLTWEAEDGDWSVVVMNGDGSAGVQADVGAGAKLPYLTEIGSSALGGGAVLLVAAAGLAVLGMRPRKGARGTPASGLAPAAS